MNENARIAYCSQRPWILASSVSANIRLAGQFLSPNPSSEALYDLSISVSRLSEDCAAWPYGEQTEIGEKGVSISGGQKARVALARAVYSDADLYLLDDPLSAVDAAVGNRLFHDCVMGALKNRNKGVILVTHQLQFLPSADRILVLNHAGLQVFLGTYEELMGRSDEFAFLDIPKLSVKQPRGGPKDDAIVDQWITSVNDVFHSQLLVSSTGETKSSDISGEVMHGAATGLETIAKAESQKTNTIIEKEEQIQGIVTFKTYLKYLRAGGSLNGTFSLVMTVLSQVIAMACDYWPRWWAADEFGDQDKLYYVWIFAILVVACLFAGFIKSVSWFSFSLNASKNLHKGSLWGVLHSPLQFFVANPTGRILNRFSKDQNVVDEQFPVVSYDFLQSFSFCLAAVILVCVAIPYLIFVVVPLMYSFVKYRERYLQSSREVKRIEAVTRSPVFSDFSAILEGLATVRAYKIEERLRAKFREQVDKNIRAWWSFQLLNRWLGFRLDLQTATILLVTVFPAVALKDSLDVGLVGFALVYVLNLSSLFQWTVRQSAEIENHMTSVERIQAYMSLPPEAGYAVKYPPHEETVVDRLRTWTLGSDMSDQNDGMYGYSKVESGNVELKASVKSGANTFEIKNLFVTYRDDLAPVLRNVSL